MVFWVIIFRTKGDYMNYDLRGRDFISDLDFSIEETEFIISLAME